MQCEECSEPGIAHITELVGGKPIDRNLCPKHASKRLGGATPDDMEAFFSQLAVRFKELGDLPPVTEFSTYGEFGARIAKRCERGPAGIFEFLKAEAQKRLAV